VQSITSLREILVLIEEVETLIEFHKHNLELLDCLCDNNSEYIEEINRRIRRLERYSLELYRHKKELMQIELALVKAILERPGPRMTHSQKDSWDIRF
jgi:sensor histidine kinase YesM